MSVADLLATPRSASANATASVTAPAQPNAVTQDAGGNASSAGSAGTGAGNSVPAAGVEYARVVSVQKEPGPRQVCTDQTIVERRHPGDHHVAGTVAGAIVGGIIGHKIGRGNGRALATAGGAVAGGAIGRHIARENDRDTVTRVVTHCRPATAAEEGVQIFDVVYAYQGQTFHARLDRDPGDRIALPVRGVE